MQCHRCKYSVQNGGTDADREAHCLNCRWEETTPARTNHGREIIFLDGADGKWVDAYVNDHAIEVNANHDIMAELELEENQARLIFDFVDAFRRLNIRQRLVALALLDCGDDNTAIVKQTGLCRPTVISARKAMEGDEVWGKLLRMAAIANMRTRRKPEVETRGLKKGTKLVKSSTMSRSRCRLE